MKLTPLSMEYCQVSPASKQSFLDVVTSNIGVVAAVVVAAVVVASSSGNDGGDGNNGDDGDDDDDDKNTNTFFIDTGSSNSDGITNTDKHRFCGIYDNIRSFINFSYT
jgi:hypothetical protein